MGEIRIGTCSWNYDSWLGLVYSQKCKSASEYLKEYSKKYSCVEIDSWFYKIPTRMEAEDYLSRVPDDFRFTCKMTEDITLTHYRNFKKQAQSIVNPNFLSIDLFHRYMDRVRGMLPRTDAIILEFEYLNKDKMQSVKPFLGALDRFTSDLNGEYPLAIETRNKNYLVREYFEFLNEKKIMHVFSEKLFMPHVYEVYGKFREFIHNKAIIRLLGGDRREIETLTNQQWNRIAAPKDDKREIVNMAVDIKNRDCDVVLNVNNHYEGSSPLTIDSLRTLFMEQGVETS